MRLELGEAVLRDWRMDDAASLARHADNRDVWRNLRDRFPHPYTLADAERWLGTVLAEPEQTVFAIEVDGAARGGAGLHPGGEEQRCAAEIGFWLGEEYWGRGIVTAVVRALTDYAFSRLGLWRVHATVYEWNGASMRVLEKNGYRCEGRMRKAVIKDGRVIDAFLYAAVRE